MGAVGCSDRHDMTSSKCPDHLKPGSWLALSRQKRTTGSFPAVIQLHSAGHVPVVALIVVEFTSFRDFV